MVVNSYLLRAGLSMLQVSDDSFELNAQMSAQSPLVLSDFLLVLLRRAALLKKKFRFLIDYCLSSGTAFRKVDAGVIQTLLKFYVETCLLCKSLRLLSKEEVSNVPIQWPLWDILQPVLTVKQKEKLFQKIAAWEQDKVTARLVSIKNEGVARVDHISLAAAKSSLADLIEAYQNLRMLNAVLSSL